MAVVENDGYERYGPKTLRRILLYTQVGLQSTAEINVAFSLTPSNAFERRRRSSRAFECRRRRLNADDGTVLIDFSSVQTDATPSTAIDGQRQRRSNVDVRMWANVGTASKI